MVTAIDALKQEMAARSLTAARTAELLGMSRVGLWKLLSGRSKPDVDTLIKIAALLNRPVGDFFEQPGDAA